MIPELTIINKLPPKLRKVRLGTVYQENMMSEAASKPFLGFGQMLLFATTTGILAGNLYYIQPLLGLLASEFGYKITDIGYLTTCTQIGYAIGILFLVPLGDVLNRRNLLTCVMGANVCGLLVAALAPNYAVFAEQQQIS